MAKLHERDKTTIALKLGGLLHPRVPHVANDKLEAYAMELNTAYKKIRVLQISIIILILGEVIYAFFK